MRKILKIFIPLFIGIVIFFVVIKKFQAKGINEAITLFFSFKGFLLFLLTLITCLISALKLRLIFRSKNLPISLKESAKIWLVGFGGSYFTPVAFLGGEPFQMHLIKKKFNTSWEKSIASVLIDKILDGTLFFAFMIAGVVAFSFYGHFPSKLLFSFSIFIISLVSGLLLIFYFLALHRASFLGWFLKFFGLRKKLIENSENGELILNTEQEVINFFSPKRKAFWEGLGLSYLRYFLLFFRTAILIFFLGEATGFFKSLAVYGFYNLSLTFPLPAALGSLEAFSTFIFSSLHFSGVNGISYALSLRGVDIIFALIGILILVSFYFKAFFE